MKNYFYLAIGLIALLLTSCETRNDLFHQANEKPTVYLNTESRNFDEKCNEVSVLLRHGQQQTIFFDYQDDYVESGVKVEYFIFSENSEQTPFICLLDAEARKIIVKDTLPSNTLNDKISKSKIKIVVSDYYGDSGEAVINIVDCDNIAPSPVINITQIHGLEYTISADESFDSDGDDIVAYEYLIDGEKTIDACGYESTLNSKSLINPGMAGMKGTYIVSTSISTVKHAFQTVGTHVISVRVKDSIGLWSSWKSKSIDIE